ncbi:hypothetical protein J4Q44_G00195310 [Coregonus suidteri]|uniref:Uncharacterized protein n=1 Tax=Coregonus suidteri TaxID=861788 RepID=A0AAN8QN33_9TELE
MLHGRQLLMCSEGPPWFKPRLVQGEGRKQDCYIYIVIKGLCGGYAKPCRGIHVTDNWLDFLFSCCCDVIRCRMSGCAGGSDAHVGLCMQSAARTHHSELHLTACQAGGEKQDRTHKKPDRLDFHKPSVTCIHPIEKGKEGEIFRCGRPPSKHACMEG